MNKSRTGSIEKPVIDISHVTVENESDLVIHTVSYKTAIENNKNEENMIVKTLPIRDLTQANATPAFKVNDIKLHKIGKESLGQKLLPILAFSDFSKPTRTVIITCILALSLLASTAIILLTIYAFIPCSFANCKGKPSHCINRGHFRAECVCDDGYSGDGKEFCDGKCRNKKLPVNRNYCFK